MSSSLALDGLQERSKLHSAAILPGSLPSSANSWVLLESECSSLQQRGPGAKLLLPHHDEALSPACHAIVSAATSPRAAHEGLQLTRTVSEWSVLLIERSSSSSEPEHREVHTPERVSFGVPPVELTDAHAGSIDAFCVEERGNFSSRAPRGCSVLRNAVLPLWAHCGCPRNAALRSSHVSLAGGVGTCAVFRKVLVWPMRVSYKGGTASSNSVDHFSILSSGSTSPTRVSQEKLDASGSDDNIVSTSSSSSTSSKMRKRKIVEDRDGDDESGNSSNNNNNNSNNSNHEDGSSVLAPYFSMTFIRNVLQNVLMMGPEHNRMRRRQRGRRCSGGRSRGVYNDDGRDNWASLSCWFSANVESLMSCTLQGIIVFVL